MKTCAKCLCAKPLSDFWRDKRRLSGLQARCKICKREDWLLFRKNNPEFDRKRYRENQKSERERHLIKKYGVDLVAYEKMLAEQDGKCAICRKAQERSFDVDHDHTTGEVRGLLCTNCNRMVGHAGDDPVRLVEAAAYLRKSRRKS